MKLTKLEQEHFDWAIDGMEDMAQSYIPGDEDNWLAPKDIPHIELGALVVGSALGVEELYYRLFDQLSDMIDEIQPYDGNSQFKSAQRRALNSLELKLKAESA